MLYCLGGERIPVFTVFTVPKHGGHRFISAPDAAFKSELRALLPTLYRIPVHDSAHGFVPGRSAITNAVPHIGFDVTISIDIEDFFHSVTAGFHLLKVPSEILERCTVPREIFNETEPVGWDMTALRRRYPDGEYILPQGFPTSPVLANIAGFAIDLKIKKMLNKMGIKSAYTRYADDLSISLRGPSLEEIEMVISKIIGPAGILPSLKFRANRRKTTIQYATGGKREICGVLVGQDGVLRATKRQRHRKRLLTHISQTVPQDVRYLFEQQGRGLAEWIAMKLPKPPTPIEVVDAREAAREANKILERCSVPKPARIHLDGLKSKLITPVVEGDFEITNDPRLISLAPAITKYPNNCTDITNSSAAWRKGTAVYCGHSGVSYAFHWKQLKETVDLGGKTFRRAFAFSRLFMGENGGMFYGRIYPTGADKNWVDGLRQWLLTNGWVRYNSTEHGTVRVRGAYFINPMKEKGFRRGSPKHGMLPYPDNTSFSVQKRGGRPCVVLTLKNQGTGF